MTTLCSKLSCDICSLFCQCQCQPQQNIFYCQPQRPKYPSLTVLTRPIPDYKTLTQTTSPFIEMSPERPGSKLSSPIGLKPYSRCPTPSSPLKIEDTEIHLGVLTRSPNITVSRRGFPTYAQYKQIETAYIASLTPRRKNKALISQDMFDRIWDVLQQPNSLDETAQFRFWARKMFTVDKSYKACGDLHVSEALLHNNLLVAVQEQIYDILCSCHGSTNHGGRDKTCGLIRQHYTWLPKDLVSGFVRACPTCILKKCGQTDPIVALAAQAQLDAEITDELEASRDGSTILPHGTITDVIVKRESDASDCSLLGSERHQESYSNNALLQKLSPHYRKPPPAFKSHSMSREVSLYKGIPNGWQYRYEDYTSAHTAFIEERKRSSCGPPDPRIGTTRPRIPSIAPLWGPDDVRNTPIDFGEDEQARLAPLESQPSGSEGSCLPLSLQPFLRSSSSQEQPYIPQIDPALIALPMSPFTIGASSFTGHPSSSSIKRSAAPPSLNFESLGPQKSLQALMAYRDGVDPGNTTPDSPNTPSWDNQSPGSSCPSHSSYLTSFPMSMTDSISPASTALPTPIGEPSNKASAPGNNKIPDDLADEACELALSVSLQAICGL